jgi:hypothetical protein
MLAPRSSSPLRVLISHLVLAAVIAGAGLGETDAVRTVVDSPEFKERFADYLKRTEGRDVDQLNAYLDSAVEDLLLDAAQISPSALSAEIRHFGGALLADLQAQLCGPPPAKLPQDRELEVTLVRGIAAAAAASSLRVSPRAHGRMGGIVANVLGAADGAALCRAVSFSDLE